jgi:molybdenum cofactor cytidylyltransferase
MNPEVTSSLGVVILGAGASVRMGKAKLLLPWGDTTVIGHLVLLWQKLGAAQIAIVTRPNDGVFMAELFRLGFSHSQCIENPQPERGMFSSVVCAAGWQGWGQRISSWAIVLGDQPHLEESSLSQLLEFAKRQPGSVCQPIFGGRVGHPVILPKTVFKELANTRATTLKDFLNLVTVPRVQCGVSDSRLSLDMDTPEDYKRLMISAL